jgi:hypothetical protein
VGAAVVSEGGRNGVRRVAGRQTVRTGVGLLRVPRARLAPGVTGTVVLPEPHALGNSFGVTEPPAFSIARADGDPHALADPEPGSLRDRDEPNIHCHPVPDGHPHCYPG